MRRLALRKGQAILGQGRIEQRGLAAQQLIDAQGQRRPLILGQIEVTAQVVSDGANPLLNAGEEAVLQDWLEKG